MAKSCGATTSGRSGDEGDEGLDSIGDQLALVRCVSPSSTSSGPEGFRNRKVEMKDGFLIVVTEEPASHVQRFSSPSSPCPSPCSSIMGNSMDDWENVYLKHSTDIVDPTNGFVFTPLHVVKELGKILKKAIHIEHYILKGPKDGNIMYRVDIMFGGVRGIGQCTRKQLARQLAAIDLYEKIQLQQAELGYRPTPIPRCGLLPGWRVDTLVYPYLFQDACKGLEVKKPIFKILPPPDRKLGKFTCICRIGDITTRAENDHPWLAKRLAAKQMYEVITGNEFPIATTLMGSEVMGFPKMKLLGFNPKITNLKRKWMMEHRIQDTQVVPAPNEPDDGDMDDVEEEAQMQQSKRVKLTELKETLSVTFPRDSGNAPGSSRVVSSYSKVLPAASTSAICKVEEEHDFSDDDFDDELIINAEDDDLIINAEDDDLEY